MENLIYVSSPQNFIFFKLVLNVDKHHYHQFIFHWESWPQFHSIKLFEIFNSLLQKVVLIL